MDFSKITTDFIAFIYVVFDAFIRKMRSADHIARTGKKIKCLSHKLIHKNCRKQTFGKPKRRWEDNIKIDNLLKK